MSTTPAKHDGRKGRTSTGQNNADGMHAPRYTGMGAATSAAKLMRKAGVKDRILTVYMGRDGWLPWAVVQASVEAACDKFLRVHRPTRREHVWYS